MKKIISAALLMLFSQQSFAQGGDFSFSNNSSSDFTPIIYISQETNNTDTIQSVGMTFLFTDYRSNLGGGFDFSIGRGEVMTENGHEEDYIAWELGLKFGYFSKLFVYGELGFDLGELLTSDDHDDDHYDGSFHFGDYDDDHYDHQHSHYNCHDNYHDDKSIDAYVGIAAGIDLGHFQVTAFSRLRKIDSEHWTIEENLFTGVKLSLSF